VIAKNMVVLFDESGTPAISNDQRTDWFLGVGVAYEQSDEEAIFSKCETDFGLANSKPLKNYRITNTRAVNIAKLLADLPVSIYVSRVNTANPAFRKIIVDYECFGESARRKFRQARKRPIPQIIHSHVLDHCLFNVITGYFEAGGGDATFAVLIDDWSIPENDIDISLRQRAASLQEKIRPRCAKFAEGRPIAIAPLELLKRDSTRKRFVDVVASTFSRAYLKADNQKYSREAADILGECGRANCSDATQYSIEIMQAVMKRASGKGQPAPAGGLPTALARVRQPLRRTVGLHGEALREHDAGPTTRQRAVMQVLKAGALYFVLVFGAGFVLGPIRILWVVPRFGERTAELMEVPIMLVVIVLSARWIARRVAVPPTAPKLLGVGVVALGLLLVVEFTVVLWLRGLTIGEYFAKRDPVAGAAYIMMLGVFGVMPLLVARR